MGAVELSQLSWPEVEAGIEAGRDTVVVAFGAFEQHGPHLPLETDVLLGDHLAWVVADRIDAFVGPTVRIGCSHHHLAFPGTLSLSDDTFGQVVGDIVRSLAHRGFRRAILLASHGGNFRPSPPRWKSSARPSTGCSQRLPIRRHCSAPRRSARMSSGCRSAKAASTPANGRPRC